MADDGGIPLSTGDRLQKVMARVGVGSRRVCEDLIADGRVTVNGTIPILGRRVDPTVDLVELDGVPLPIQPGLVHYLLNKPAGVVSTAEDTHGRPTVVSLVPEEPRVFPVGRLDMDSEGLLIVTNDGVLTHRLTHPSFGVPKEYLVSVEGEPTSGQIRQLHRSGRRQDGTGPGGRCRPLPAPFRHP
jgi:23S rRNA pseudouridine2605 synthase